jgi:predicted secreted protein
MLEKDDSSRTLVMAVDETFAVELAADTSAGFEWIPIHDGDVVSYLGQETISVLEDDGELRARRRLSFRSLMPGDHCLVLLYKRRWERAVSKRLTLWLQVAERR